MIAPIKAFTDLHCHSTYSDGTNTPEQLAVIAKDKNLAGIALTDHDTIEGIEPLLAAGIMHDVEIITGVELSANHDEIPVHILGYGFDHKHTGLLTNLAKIQQTREARNHKIFANIKKMHIDITWNQIKTISGDGQVGRPHFAAFLIEQGIVANNEEAFNIYLRKGRPAYAEREKLPVEEAIGIIHGAGGVAVIAHPGLIPCSQGTTMQLINTFTSMGLDGIEAYYPTHSNTIRKRLLNLCSEKDLVVTGGSDYHGGIRANTSLGGFQKRHRIPAFIFADLYNRLQSLKNNTL
ncbi:MAG: PHP domain-containing protein [Desulfobulbaceae bacterium]|jgi:predicted metal-dependent phosphoesterase TrpH|nr:PHP domain-containing protein [Desulfobulbaceae bacterium]